MIGWILKGLLDGLISGLTVESIRRNQVRGWHKAFEQGRDVAFPGFARGDVPYRPSLQDGAGALVLSCDQLYWTADPGFGRGLWHRIPVERLVVVERTHGTGASGLSSWPGYECRDGQRTVVILCDPEAERYLRLALGLPEEHETQSVTDAVVDPDFWFARGGPRT